MDPVDHLFALSNPVLASRFSMWSFPEMHDVVNNNESTMHNTIFSAFLAMAARLPFILIVHPFFSASECASCPRH